MCDVDVRWQYTGRTRAGGRADDVAPASERAPKRRSVPRSRAQILARSWNFSSS